MPPKKNANAKGPKSASKADDEGKGKEKKGGGSSTVKVSFTKYILDTGLN